MCWGLLNKKLGCFFLEVAPPKLSTGQQASAEDSPFLKTSFFGLENTHHTVDITSTPVNLALSILRRYRFCGQ